MRIDTRRFAFRARREAERYGNDPWVFVRELLQNARDAGAGRIDWQIRHHAGREVVVCRDDGCGMTIDDARRFLFTLYASSKRGSPVDAGRFGVGFWSVLRFNPETVIVRSRTRDGDPWQATLDGDLQHLEVGPWRDGSPATEVELRRAVSDVDLRRRITEVVQADAPFLRCRDRPDDAVEIRVDDVRVSREPSLPPPSIVFSRPGVRGVVGLGDVPRVDLFARGLRVRSAATLDELVEGSSGERPGRAPVTFSPGLAPRVLVDADGLEVLAARGDARADRELRRVVRTARRELDRLVALQLDAVAPLAPGTRLAAAARRLWTGVRARRSLLGLGAVAIIVVAVAIAGVGWLGDRRDPDGPAADGGRPSAVGGLDVLDLDRAYDEPGLGLGGSPAVADTTYEPADLKPWLAVVRRVAPRRGGDVDLRRDDGPECRDGCLVLSTSVARSGLVRLPEPTGWRIDPSSVRLDDRRLDLWRSASGEAVVETVDGAAGRLEWTAGPAPGPELRAVGGWPELPTEAVRVVDGTLGAPFDEMVERFESWVRTRIRYDRSPATVARHRMLASEGLPLFDRLVEVGAGDCDLQNALLAAMFDRAGARARMAVGILGIGGRVSPGLHAWVEVRRPDGRWRVVDASTPGSPPIVADAATTPHPISDAGTGPARSTRIATWIVALIGASLATGALTLGWRGRSRRRLETVPDLASERLVRAALERPDALGVRAELGRRALVPTIGGGRLSTQRCRELARGRRIVACRRVEWWRAAVGRSGPVTVDLDDPAGREVAVALHLPVVDDWAPLLDHAEVTDCTERVEGALRAVGFGWSVRAVRDAPERAVAVAGWKRPGPTGRGLVLVRSSVVAPVAPAGVLDMTGAVCDAIGLSDRVSRRVRARVARDLLRGTGP